MKSIIIGVFLFNISCSFAQKGFSEFASMANCDLAYLKKIKFSQSELEIIKKNPQLYLWDHNVFEGHKKSLKFKIETYLRNELPIKIEEIDKGKTGARLFTYANGLKAVFKTRRDTAHNGWNFIVNSFSEIAAYRFDQLYKFDLVPLTTSMIYKGESGSLQLYVKAKDIESLKLMPDSADKQKLQVLDYIMFNTDRDHNTLLTANKRFVAIDNGMAFSSGDYTRVDSYRLFFNSEEGKNLMKRLKTISDDEIRQVFSPYMKEYFVDGIIIRRDKIIQNFGN